MSDPDDSPPDGGSPPPAVDPKKAKQEGPATSAPAKLPGSPRNRPGAANQNGIVIPETLKYILVAVVAMVMFRFFNELGPSQEAKAEASGHAVEEGSATMKAVSGRKFNLAKNQVLIEFCGN